MTPEVIIQRLVYELDFEKEKPAWALQDEIPRLHESITIAVLKKLFAGLPDFDGVLRIDRIELDLGDLSLDRFRQQFRVSMEKELRKKMNAILRTSSQGTSQYSPKNKGRRDSLEFMLQTGRYPWWEARESGKGMQAILKEVMDESPEKTKSFWRRLSRNEAVLERLAQQLDEPTFAMLIRFLAKEQGVSLAVWYRKVLESNKKLGIAPHSSFKNRFRKAVLGFLFSKTAGQVPVGEAKKIIAQTLSSDTGISSEAAAFYEKISRMPSNGFVEPAFWNKSEADLLAHFLTKGFVPAWGILEKGESVAELAEWVLKAQPAAFFALVAKTAFDHPFWRRVLFQMEMPVFEKLLFLFETKTIAAVWANLKNEVIEAPSDILEKLQLMEQVGLGTAAVSNKILTPEEVDIPEEIIPEESGSEIFSFIEIAGQPISKEMREWATYLRDLGKPSSLELWEAFLEKTGPSEILRQWAIFVKKSSHPAVLERWEAFLKQSNRSKDLSKWLTFLAETGQSEDLQLWEVFLKKRGKTSQAKQWEAFLKKTGKPEDLELWEAYNKEVKILDDFEIWEAFVKNNGKPWWKNQLKEVDFPTLTANLVESQPARVGQLLKQNPQSIGAAIEGREHALLMPLLRIFSPAWAEALSSLLELTKTAAPQLMIGKEMLPKLYPLLLKTAIRFDEPGAELPEIARRWILVLSKITGASLHAISTMLVRTGRKYSEQPPITLHAPLQVALQEVSRNVAEAPTPLVEMGSLPPEALAQYNILRLWLKGEKSILIEDQSVTLGDKQAKVAFLFLKNNHPDVLKAMLREAFLVKNIRRRFAMLKDEKTFETALQALIPGKFNLLLEAIAALTVFGKEMGFGGTKTSQSIQEEALRLAAYGISPRHLVTFFMQLFEKARIQKGKISSPQAFYRLWRFALKTKGPTGQLIRSALAAHPTLDALSTAQRERYLILETAILLEKPILSVWGLRGKSLLALIEESLRELPAQPTTAHPTEIAALLFPILLDKLLIIKRPTPAEWLRLVSMIKRKTGRAEREFARKAEKYLQSKAQDWSLPLQKTTRKKKKEPIAETAEEDAIYVNNAGLVILHPYFSTLFKLLEIDIKEPEQAARAVHLLQFLATGRSETPEEELVLNKILCGVPLETPIAAGIDMTDDERDRCGQIFNALRSHWPSMKNSSDDNFRGSFLLRPGKLTVDQGFWLLRIPPGLFDMLMQTMPWRVSHIKYSWMPVGVRVEWG